jgi:hypothetical protein
VPLTCEATGALGAWDSLEDGEFIEIWNLVFGEEYSIEQGDFRSNRFVVAKNLVRQDCPLLPLLTTMYLSR